jgi:hypothetical protein
MADEQIVKTESFFLMIQEPTKCETNLSQQYKILAQAIDTCDQIMFNDEFYQKRRPYFVKEIKALKNAIQRTRKARTTLRTNIPLCPMWSD